MFAMATSPHSLTPDAQLLPHIFTTSPIAFAVEDLDGTPLYVNPAFCSFLGFSGEELRHKHLALLPESGLSGAWGCGSLFAQQLGGTGFRPLRASSS